MFKRLGRRGAVMVGVVAFAALLLCLLAIPGMRPRDLLLARWRSELPRLADSEAAQRLQRIAALGDQTLPDLVAGLDDRRESVARTARRLLSERLDRWQLLNQRDSSPKVVALARLMAAHTDTMQPRGRRAAAEIATRLLVWPLDGERTSAAALIVDCEKVLRAAGSNQSPLVAADWPVAAGGTTVAASGSASLYRSGIHRAGNRRATGTDLSVDDGALEAPGGDLPIEILRVPQLRPAATDRPPPPAPLPMPGERPAALPDAVPDQPARPIPVRPSQPATPRSSPAASQQTNPARSLAAETPSPAPSTQPLQRVGYLPESMSDWELMQQLHDGDIARLADAQRELTRRGFRPFHLQLAWRMTHPESAVRRQLAADLPKLEDVPLRAWLVQLSHDSDVAVRRSVVATMATSQDPQLHRRLLEMLDHESDATVLEQLKRFEASRR